MKQHSYKSFNALSMFWFLVFLFCIVQTGIGQEQKDRKNFVFIEGLGSGPYYSLNFGRQVFKKKQFEIAGRIGFSSYRFKDFKNKFNPDLIIPLGTQLSYGKQHKITAGFGNTFTGIIKAGSKFEPKRSWSNHGYFMLGYSFQKQNSPFFFSAAYQPLVERYQAIRHWVSIQVGFFF